MESSPIALAARTLAEEVEEPPLRERLERLAERVTSGSFHVAVVGEFNRGKSTLINALVGQEVVPTGVIPLTAIATEIAAGDDAATIVFGDGATRQIPLSELADWITEDANPGNTRNVARACVAVASPLLTDGLVIVDTPGIGSVHHHNTTAALAATQEADGAIVVLAADSPLSDAERLLLTSLRAREASTFVVLNKIDHLEPSELVQVIGFIQEAVGDPSLSVWPLSARVAACPSMTDPGFEAFRAAFISFTVHDLAGARSRSNMFEARDIAQQLSENDRLTVAAAALDADTLVRRVAAFREAAEEQRVLAEGDHLVIAQQARHVAAALSSRLRDDARRAAQRRMPELHTVAQEVPARHARDRLWEAVQRIVTDEFDPIRDQAVTDIDRQWLEIARRSSSRTAARLASIREAAAAEFDLSLAWTDLPSVDVQPERFSYLFLPPTMPPDPFAAIGRVLLPAPLVRAHALRRAQGQLARELDKHAGRLRHDLDARLMAAVDQFVKLLNAQLADATRAVLDAAARGEELRQAGLEAQAQHRRAAALRNTLADSLVSACTAEITDT